MSTKNIKTERPSKKLDHKMIGPYKIKQLVRLSCQLDLSISIKIHDIFHLSLLWKATNNPLPDQHNNSAPPVIINDKEEWKINDILNARKKGEKKVEKKVVGKKIQYHVKWKRYNENKEWYNASGFEHAKKIIDDFYKRNPTKPRQK